MATSVLPSPVFISAILPVEDDAADQLDVKVAHPDDAGRPRGRRRRLRGGCVEGGLFGGVPCPDLRCLEGVGDALAEFDGLGPELLVGEPLDGGLKLIDLLDAAASA